MFYGSFINTAPPVSVSNPYTYIDTLQYTNANIWNSAVALVSSFNSIHSGNTAKTRKDNAVAFLRQVAEQWRNNEWTFITNEINKLQRLYNSEQDINKQDKQLANDIKEITDMVNNLNTNGFNYQIFASLLSRIVKGIDNYKGRLSNIKANFSRDARFNDRGLLQGIDTEFKNIIELLNGEAKWIDYQRKSYEKLVATFVYEYVDSHEDELRAHLTDDKQFAAWLLTLSTNFRVYLEKVHAEEREKLEKDYKNARQSLKQNFDNFIKEEQDWLLSFTAEDIKHLSTIADSFGFQAYNEKIKKANIKLPTLSTVPTDNYDVAFTSTLGPSAFDEQLGLLVHNAMQTMRQMGGSGMGNDSIGAVLNIQYTEPNYDKILSYTEETIKNLDESMTEFAKLRDNRSQVATENKRMNEAIESHLTKLDQQLEELEGINKAFIIHESDKYYQSMEAGFEKNWNAELGGFHGRTMAILNYIDIMNNLSKDFGMGSIPLMKFVAYNLGSHSPATSTTISTLEEIFTYAAGMIMFDDIGVAVKEATKELQFSNITNLHLYKLQELYFPGSYLLEQTANYLDGMEYTATDAVTTEILVEDNIYVPNYLDLYQETDAKKRNETINRIFKWNASSPEERWNTMRNYMASHTKVSIHFFLNFVSFIKGMS